MKGVLYLSSDLKVFMNKESMSKYKLYNPCRKQVQMEYGALDDKIPEDHKARKVWGFVEKMDLSPCFRKVNTFKGKSGQKTTSPKVIFALWLFALVEGVYSGRKIAELCEEHDAYRWIAGGVPINRTMICEFRSLDPTVFQDLLTTSLAVMVKARLLNPQDCAQDGTKIQSAAGFNSYRRNGTLKDFLKVAKKYTREVEKLNKKEPSAFDKRRKSAQLRAKRERVEGIEEAIKELEQYQTTLEQNAKKNHSKKPSQERIDKLRTSYVDPQVRKMKMGDGGFRLAYNVQFATETESRVILGVNVVNTLDPGTLSPMVAQVMGRLKKLALRPIKHWLADIAYSGKNDVEEVSVFHPDLKLAIKANPLKSLKPSKGDSEAMLRYKKYIVSEEFKEVYKSRPSTAEFSNMQCKARGMGRMLVKGINKVSSTAILYAIMHNMMRFWDLSGLNL